MNDEINYKNNPLHGVSLKNMLTELVDHYGFEILFAYLRINCFKTNPSVESSVKFLKHTDWAREKVENFYLYQFKSLPRASDDQYDLSPRDRIIPDGDQPGEPAKLSIEDAEQLQAKREKKAASFGKPRQGYGPGKPRQERAPSRTSRPSDGKSSAGNPYTAKPSAAKPAASKDSGDPWSKWRK
ncbi:VF530 family DNA-binding protein [Pseudomaricurvus sp. HS19]|uniref:VF530 family protein n=1 Tax=Pseudomaricurvus sp. HS19 TaxID=2692626 RepID=UPI001370E476|nr:VF530 family protein [Pseudomaricurvus sp. HS19]MYM64877.1 DNA-binding protein VF530 [Pseudomaricurvus sp. HS19]